MKRRDEVSSSVGIRGNICEAWGKACLVVLVMAATAIASPAQIFTPIANFDGPHGANPTNMKMVQGFDGSLYGVTQLGGAHGWGVVFKVAGGTITDLHDFTGGSDGGAPVGGLVVVPPAPVKKGHKPKPFMFYGTTPSGGTIGLGTIYKVSANGALTTVHSFNGADGQDPSDHLILATDGKFYGTTFYGGSIGSGTVFKMTAAGVLTVMHSFGSSGDGAFPTAALVQGTDGNFYGTTTAGGANNAGTVFQMTPTGKLAILHSFSQTGTDGYQPYAELVEDLDGNFYGTTTQGGSLGGGGGTLFQITPAGVFTVLHAFTGYEGDGSIPFAGLVTDPGGFLYGTTSNGGTAGAACNCGTIFVGNGSVGGYEMQYSFTNKADGRLPIGGLMQTTDGFFYGTTLAGGNSNPACTYDATHTCGTIYQWSEEEGPFVTSLPTSGKVGKNVWILGSNLTGATAVSFNGTSAAISCNAGTYICTQVPVGATTGYVTVTTPGGVLKSNVPFHVP